MLPYEANFVALLYDFLKDRGHDPELVLGRALSPQVQLTSLEWEVLLQRAEQTVRLPAFGIALGEHLELRHLGVIGYLLMSSSSAIDALQRAQRYDLLLTRLNPLQISIEDDQLVMSWPLVNGWGGQVHDELGLAIATKLCRILLGVRGTLTQVDFVGPRPANTDVYEEFFGCAVKFEKPFPKLVGPLSQVFLPIIGANPELCDLLDTQAEARLQSLAPLAHDLQKLRQELLHLIRDGRPRITDLAVHNRTNVRSVQRRLASHGITFQMLLEETRSHLAEQYLMDKRLSLFDIADLLGYCDQTAFTRAFRKWRGTTPGAWRSKMIMANT